MARIKITPAIRKLADDAGVALPRSVARRTGIRPDPAPATFAGKVLGLDVSSTASGFAVIRTPRTLVTSGVSKPRAKLKPHDRIDLMVAELKRVAAEHSPDIVIMEITSGMVYHRARASSLAMLAFAQGAVREAMKADGHRVETLTELVWTRRVAKPDRAASVAREFPGYAAHAAQDGGMDESDAIGVAMYWLANPG